MASPAISEFAWEYAVGDMHPAAVVAPLNIQKSPKRSQSRVSGHRRQSSSRGGRSVQSEVRVSPPLTPRSSSERLPQQPLSPPKFHNYLRAFYHFNPSSTVSSSTDESSITVALNQGDVILVHSVHPNGWADGTLLASGARGWLPTNYCEAYDHPMMLCLLSALTNLWDLVRHGEAGEISALSEQDYVRGMIAGVRTLLEKSNCLSKEMPLVLAHVGLRRLRKGMLGDLSSLVRTAKTVQERLQLGETCQPDLAQLDALVVKAFKLVNRAVRFLDLWTQHTLLLAESDAATRERPLTPPSDPSSHFIQSPTTSRYGHSQSFSANSNVAPAALTASANAIRDSVTTPLACNSNRLSVAFSLPSDSDTLQSPSLPPPLNALPHRTSVAHRLSYTGRSQGRRASELVSEQLDAAHDAFLGFIGSFIGLHLHSRSSEELIATTEQSVAACRKFLQMVQSIWERDLRRSEPLAQAQTMMQTRLAGLVQAAKDTFGDGDDRSGDDRFETQSRRHLVGAATNCVRAATDCVTSARWVIGRIGDFELEDQKEELSKAIFAQLEQNIAEPTEASLVSEVVQPVVEVEKPLPLPPTKAVALLPPLVMTEPKPLPEVPEAPKIPQISSEMEDSSNDEPLSTMIVKDASLHLDTSASLIQPLDHLSVPRLPPSSSSEYSPSPTSATRRFFGKAGRADSVNTSVADSSSSYHYSMRGDTGSVVSLTSTRATTPDHSPARMQGDQMLVTSFGSLTTTASEDVATIEEHIKTTFAHQLVYNKEGQIAGGSLPALVEQLTAHECTPDAVFVTAFYLTFRQFTTPAELARSLIYRFEYIGDSESVGIPVRLRVFNVFKGWLESHWRADTDSEALDVISSFATERLRVALPAAGKHLAELTSKVMESRNGALVPRLVSSLGKIGVAAAIYTIANDNVPASIITRSQTSALKAWKDGKGTCSILDFDPLELARQFTLIESKLFCSIQAEELLALEWTKKTGSKAVNVLAMSTLSNDLANLVADSILQLEDPKKRAVVIKKWIKIALQCLELNNYDSLMAIICSLNSSTVLRLKRTWEHVSAKTQARLEELKAVTDVGRNYAVLRQRLQNHVAPCIPFVGIYLTDLTFVDVGNCTTRQLPKESGQDGVSVINFDKHMKTAKVIGQLQSFQHPYRLAAIPEMQEWMEAQIQCVRTSDEANVQSYYRRSLVLEPREAPQPVRPTVVPAESSIGGPLTAESRSNSKDRFDFLNFHFSSHLAKER